MFVTLTNLTKEDVANNSINVIKTAVEHFCWVFVSVVSNEKAAKFVVVEYSFWFVRMSHFSLVYFTGHFEAVAVFPRMIKKKLLGYNEHRSKSD